MAEEIIFDDISHLFEDEELFARDDDGRLMLKVKSTEKDYFQKINVVVDGETVEMRKAVPLTDSQGNTQFDEDGNTKFRQTTIWDAAQKRYVRGLGQDNPVPVLCHQEHLRPVAVCRICTVQTFRLSNGVRSAAGKLLPACFQPVQPNMEVHTVNSPEKEIADKVQKSVGLITEMLAADHLSPDGDPNVPNELQKLSDRLDCDPSRFTPAVPVHRSEDDSSSLIRINHNNCVLCDRCVRSCTEVKKNFVIGRTGKGYKTQIGFDLHDLMGDSSCVSCGECMMNCPTDALTFRHVVESDWWKECLEQPEYSAVSAEELRSMPLFRKISFKFLQWNSGAAVRRRVKKGDVLCVQGDYGATAFLLNSGKFGIYVGELKKKSGQGGGFFSNIFGRKSEESGSHYKIEPGPYGNRVGTMGPENIIVGEMTCLNSHQRTATIIADEDGEVLEIRRNFLYMLQRNRDSRSLLDRVYRERALANLKYVPFFKDLTPQEQDDCTSFLRERVELFRLEPGQVLFRQGQESDAFYMVRIGHVKVSQMVRGEEKVLSYLRPNHYLGEIGLVSASLLDLPSNIVGKRTATCTALDDVELVRINKDVFEEMVQRYPTLLRQVRNKSEDRLKEVRGMQKTVMQGPLGDFLGQGLFNGQKLLVLDLEACTRCDECSKACADTHGGVTRLVREGLRFDKYLVASACRSCTDPYCMVGCPVDAIHREDFINITIENHCIGCGQCAKNCPYGNINMAGFPDPLSEGSFDRAVVRQKATTCDLCQSVPAVAGNPDAIVSCVYNCPHDAAFRMSGPELYDKVNVS